MNDTCGCGWYETYIEVRDQFVKHLEGEIKNRLWLNEISPKILCSSLKGVDSGDMIQHIVPADCPIETASFLIEEQMRLGLSKYGTLVVINDFKLEVLKTGEMRGWIEVVAVQLKKEGDFITCQTNKGETS